MKLDLQWLNEITVAKSSSILASEFLLVKCLIQIEIG